MKLPKWDEKLIQAQVQSLTIAIVFELISERIFDFLNFPKNHLKIWQISAQEPKRCWNHQNKEISYTTRIYIWLYGLFDVLKAFFLWFDHFLDCWAGICQIFWWFFGKLKKIKMILKSSDLYKFSLEPEKKSEFWSTSRLSHSCHKLKPRFPQDTHVMELWVLG